MATKSLYRLAHSELLSRGLHKGDLVDPVFGVKVCALGACAAASGQEIVKHTELDYDNDGNKFDYEWYAFKGAQERSIHEAFPELAKAAEELFPGRVEHNLAEYNTVPTVNDANETTLEDVELIFARAEELADLED